MNYFLKMSKKNDKEFKAQVESTKDAPKPRKPIMLSFWAGEFTFQDGETKKTGEVKDSDHTHRLVARATELAEEKKAKLIVSDAGHAILAYCKDFR